MTDEKDDHPQAHRIRERAYLIWEKDGRPDGHAIAHWVKAKQEIEAEDSAAQANPPPPDETGR